MSKRSVFAAALLGTILLVVPLQSQAFFGFFGGGFSFGTGWSGWGGPGWWGPGWYRPGYFGGPRYGWGRPFWGRRYWSPVYRPVAWPYLGYGWPSLVPAPSIADRPAAPTAPETIEK
jgi:hypothetical protein